MEISNQNFADLMANEKPLVIDFWAEWCGPCRAIAPVVEELANEYAESVNIGKCNVDENNDIAVQFGIRNIPTILFIKGGEVVDKQVGAVSKAALEEKIKALL